MVEGLKELFDLSAGFKPVTYHIKAESDSFLNAKQKKRGLLLKLSIKDLGRIETRKYTLDTNIDWLDNKKEWKNMKAFVMCESIVIRNGKERIEKRYFITGLTDVEKVAKGIRSHWETRE